MPYVKIDENFWIPGKPKIKKKSFFSLMAMPIFKIDENFWIPGMPMIKKKFFIELPGCQL